MKTLVIYDSTYGNTEKIARTIGSVITGDVEVMHIDKVNPLKIGQVDFLFVGSPTHGGKTTKAMNDFLNILPTYTLKAAKVAAFDTRVSSKLVGIFGNAAGKIIAILRSRGASIISQPEGFFVNGKEGPLKEGELVRAASWGKEMVRL